MFLQLFQLFMLGVLQKGPKAFAVDGITGVEILWQAELVAVVGAERQLARFGNTLLRFQTGAGQLFFDGDFQFFLGSFADHP